MLTYAVGIKSADIDDSFIERERNNDCIVMFRISAGFGYTYDNGTVGKIPFSFDVFKYEFTVIIKEHYVRTYFKYLLRAFITVPSIC